MKYRFIRSKKRQIVEMAMFKKLLYNDCAIYSKQEKYIVMQSSGQHSHDGNSLILIGCMYTHFQVLSFKIPSTYNFF